MPGLCTQFFWGQWGRAGGDNRFHQPRRIWNWHCRTSVSGQGQALPCHLFFSLTSVERTMWSWATFMGSNARHSLPTFLPWGASFSEPSFPPSWSPHWRYLCPCLGSIWPKLFPWKPFLSSHFLPFAVTPPNNPGSSHPSSRLTYPQWRAEPTCGVVLGWQTDFKFSVRQVGII